TLQHLRSPLQLKPASQLAAHLASGIEAAQCQGPPTRGDGRHHERTPFRQAVTALRQQTSQHRRAGVTPFELETPDKQITGPCVVESGYYSRKGRRESAAIRTARVLQAERAAGATRPAIIHGAANRRPAVQAQPAARALAAQDASNGQPVPQPRIAAEYGFQY